MGVLESSSLNKRNFVLLILLLRKGLHKGAKIRIVLYKKLEVLSSLLPLLGWRAGPGVAL